MCDLWYWNCILQCLQYNSATLLNSVKEFHTSINGLKKSEIVGQEIPMKPTGILKRLMEIPASNISARGHNRHMQAVVDSQACTGEYLRQDLAAIVAVLSNLAYEVKQDRTLGVFIFDHILGILDGTLRVSLLLAAPFRAILAHWIILILRLLLISLKLSLGVRPPVEIIRGAPMPSASVQMTRYCDQMPKCCYDAAEDG